MSGMELDWMDGPVEGCIPINPERTEGFFDDLPICDGLEGGGNDGN